MTTINLPVFLLFWFAPLFGSWSLACFYSLFLDEPITASLYDIWGVHLLLTGGLAWLLPPHTLWILHWTTTHWIAGGCTGLIYGFLLLYEIQLAREHVVTTDPQEINDDALLA